MQKTRMAITIPYAAVESIRSDWQDAVADETEESSARAQAAANLQIAEIINGAGVIAAQYFSTTGTFQWTYGGTGTADKQVARILDLLMTASNKAVEWHESGQPAE